MIAMLLKAAGRTGASTAGLQSARSQCHHSEMLKCLVGYLPVDRRLPRMLHVKAAGVSPEATVPSYDLV